MRESEDGNVVAFVAANRLFCYNITTNKLTLVFSFYDSRISGSPISSTSRSPQVSCRKLL